ncbi:hypothetical protein CDL12_04052 [Handroanthus impetiginosus]|uniref:Uncharacterized protein n=1 Tax=Handroanthus impetiginosus TaxID=429701 RepID=A0A2G9I0D3_9LAMI|nr:hypothetical protein CDL12_04052 [Handroanthus impetiginosus]
MQGVGINAASFLLSFPFNFLQIAHYFSVCCFVSFSISFTPSLLPDLVFPTSLSSFIVFLNASVTVLITASTLNNNNARNSKFRDKNWNFILQGLFKPAQKFF